MKGRIHSIESMGLVDGPGIRVVVFFQGCALRCSYCHNPDTWDTDGGIELTAEELLKKIMRFKPYFDRSGGGVTFSGGDPLLQPDFLVEVLKLCKQNDIHTALDTAGYGVGKYDEILRYTDLILLDIKHVDDTGYKDLTGRNMHGFSTFLKAAQGVGTKLWIRHVVVPGVTDSEQHITSLAGMIKEIRNVDKIELLPYHTLGVEKYKQLGIKYRLEGVNPVSKERINELTALLNSIIES
jgi:pyruvate formate lyase activating enzyme